MATAGKTYSMQHTLPRLPVPSLDESCALYLQSLKPLLSHEEYTKTAKLVHDFSTGSLGQSLQQRLLDIDKVSPSNWLEDNFWLRKAYLEWREPLMVNSNWYMLGVDDPNHPEELLRVNGGKRPSGEFTHFQLQRAAHLIHRGLEYKEILENEAIPVDTLRGKAVCMWQHSRIFALTRIPMHHCDELVQHDMASSRHIVILVRDQVYKLPVYTQQADGSWTRLTRQEIETRLLGIVHHVLRLEGLQQQPPIGLLTSWDRDNWAVARNHLLALDAANRATAGEIESSLFAVALDDYSNGADPAGRSKMAFCGHLGLGNGHNRWFDKCITLLVESNGQCVYAGEHSPADALLVSYVFDHMLLEPCPGPFDTRPVVVPPTSDHGSHFQHLTWKIDDCIAKCLENAQKAADATAAFSDSYVEVFAEYGTDWIKKVAKLSPDAFYQMTLQIAYYRIHSKVVPTYETASTRQFLHGRTDTIRTCSVESKRLVEQWMNERLDPKAKYNLLKDAVNAHRKYTQISSNGHGCDRHLMVLRLLNTDHQVVSPTTGKLEPAPMHPMFQDPIFAKSQTWTLSTSGLHAGIRLMGTGFGAATHDGYGVNYMAAPTLVKFGIEVKQVPETVSAQEFGATLRKTLLELKDLCEQVNGQAASSTKGQAAGAQARM